MQRIEEAIPENAIAENVIAGSVLPAGLSFKNGKIVR